MELNGEIDYTKYTNELLLNARAENIPDYIEALKETSILKGEVFYKKIKKSANSHWSANAVNNIYKSQHDSIQKHCDFKIKEINNEKGFWPKILRHNLISGTGGVIIGALITWLVSISQPEKTPKVQIDTKVQVVHDTIYVTNLQGCQDTSLVRLVK